MIPAIYAIEVIELDDGSLDPPIQATGTKIEVALIQDYIDQRIDSLTIEFQAGLQTEKTELYTKMEEITNYISVKLGLGIVCICLFIFNISLAFQLFSEVVFKNG